MNIIPRAGPPPLPSSTGAAASIRIPRFVAAAPRRASVAQVRSPGEVHRQSLEGRQIQRERPSDVRSSDLDARTPPSASTTSKTLTLSCLRAVL